MLEASNLECVRGEKSLFRGLSFRPEPGACLMVQGANGSGKTSLQRMICGLSQPAQGEIRWTGEPIRKLAEEYRGELLYCGHAGAVEADLTGWVRRRTCRCWRPCWPWLPSSDRGQRR